MKGCVAVCKKSPNKNKQTKKTTQKTCWCQADSFLAADQSLNENSFYFDVHNSWCKKCLQVMKNITQKGSFTEEAQSAPWLWERRLNTHFHSKPCLSERGTTIETDHIIFNASDSAEKIRITCVAKMQRSVHVLNTAHLQQTWLEHRTL